MKKVSNNVYIGQIFFEKVLICTSFNKGFVLGVKKPWKRGISIFLGLWTINIFINPQNK